jgi:hypothetical protein
MSIDINPDVQEPLDNLEALVANLPPESRRDIFNALADLLDALAGNPLVAVERRPRPPLRPMAQQIRTIVNRLRDKAQARPGKKAEHK